MNIIVIAILGLITLVSLLGNLYLIGYVLKETYILKPEFLKISQQKENREIPFIYVNPDDFPMSREMVDLTNIPMVVAFKEGKEIANEYGNKKEIVSKVLSILLG